AVIGVLEHAAGGLDLALGRAIDHIVERSRHVAEPFLETRPVALAAREHEAAIALHPRRLHHRQLRILGVEALRIAVIERYRLEASIEMVGPAVIAAGELRGI